jgi:hypothetical protein
LRPEPTPSVQRDSPATQLPRAEVVADAFAELERAVLSPDPAGFLRDAPVASTFLFGTGTMNPSTYGIASSLKMKHCGLMSIFVSPVRQIAEGRMSSPAEGAVREAAATAARIQRGE